MSKHIHMDTGVLGMYPDACKLDPLLVGAARTRQPIHLLHACSIQLVCLTLAG